MDQPAQKAAETTAKMIAVGRYSKVEQQGIARDACAICGVPGDQAAEVLARAKILAAELRSADAELKRQVERTLGQLSR